MDKLLDLVKLLSSNNFNKQNDQSNFKNNDSIIIPKEITEQYPYGQFPLQYTKSGQETIRKQSENRFSYETHLTDSNNQQEKKDNNLDLNLLLPLIQIMSGQKKQPNDIFKAFSKILFKNNPDMEKIFNLFPQSKPKEIKPESNFPSTNKVSISSLKRIN